MSNQKKNTAAGEHFLLRLLFICITYILRNVLKSAMQNTAKFIKRFGFHIFICFQPTHCLTVNSALLTQCIR